MATETFGTANTALEKFFRERYPEAVRDATLAVDPVYRQLVVNNEKVVRSEMGKDWVVLKHAFSDSVTGALRYANPQGPDFETTGTGGMHQRLAASSANYPGRDDFIFPLISEYGFTLAQVRGAIVLSTKLLKADEALETVADESYVTRTMMLYAKHLATQMAVNWFLDDDAAVVVLKGGSTVAVDGNVATITNNNGVIKSGCPFMLVPGMQFDCITIDTDESQITDGGWALLDSRIDYYAGKNITSLRLYFKDATDASDFKTALQTNSKDVRLAPYSAVTAKTIDGHTKYKSILPIGWRSWMRSSGTLFGLFGRPALTVENYGSAFKSLVVDNGGNVLTEQKVLETYKKFEAATGVELDTIITTEGVVQAILNAYNIDATSPLIRIPREQTEGAQITLGTATEPAVHFRVGARTFRVLTSKYMPAGTFVMMKIGGGNLIRYEPPALDELHATGEAVQQGTIVPIEWQSKIVSGTIWRHADSGTSPTELIMAPFDIYLQHAAEEVRGVVINNCQDVLG